MEMRTFPPEERRAFVDFINQLLADDPTVGNRLPINTENEDFFAAVGDGLILCKLVGKCVRGSLDEKKMILKENMNAFEKGINCQLFLETCVKAGIKVVSIGDSDIMAGKPHLVLGLVWQLIKKGLFSSVFLNHPELVMLLEPGRPASDLQKLSDEDLVMRWVNWHLRECKSGRQISNFGKDIQDGEAYVQLFHSLNLLEGPVEKHTSMPPEGRAQAVLDGAKKVKCSKFVTASDITSGNARLNFAFLANLFATNPRMPALAEAYQVLSGEHQEALAKVAELEAVKVKMAEVEAAKIVAEAKLETAATEAKVAVQQELVQLREKVAEKQEVETKHVAAVQESTNREEEYLARIKELEAQVAALQAALDAKTRECEAAATEAEAQRQAADLLRATYDKTTGQLDKMKEDLDASEEAKLKALRQALGAKSLLEQLQGCMAAQKEGWLRKQGRGFKSWKRRWFSLRGRLLFYFNDLDGAKAQKPLGVLYLDEYTVGSRDDANPMQMTLLHKTLATGVKGQFFLMEAADDADRASWVEWMEKVMADPDFEVHEHAT